MLSTLRPLASALALALAPPDAAGTQPPAAEPPGAAAPEASPRTDPARGAPAGEGAPPANENGWIDAGHAFIEQRIFAPILRLDRFFSDERELDAERSRSFVRWRNEIRFTEGAPEPGFTTGVRANLRLPGLYRQLRRLRVVIAGEARDALLSLFSRRPGAAPGEEEEPADAGTAGLRLFLLDTLLAHADLGAGILTRLPPGGYGQVRLRVAVPAGRLFLGRSFVSGFWRTDTRFGTSAGLELERPLNRTFAARLGGSATLTELSQGVEWASELALFANVDARSAAQLALGVNGATEPSLASDQVTRPPEHGRGSPEPRQRRARVPHWVFAELEPEVAWPWTLERGRHRAWGVALRLEVQFQGEEAPPPPPPAAPPEPEDPPPLDALPDPAAPG